MSKKKWKHCTAKYNQDNSSFQRLVRLYLLKEEQLLWYNEN